MVYLTIRRNESPKEKEYCFSKPNNTLFFFDKHVETRYNKRRITVSLMDVSFSR